ncbi:hypothetical protein IP88_05135 [alpha proteobacterium AAP81b]|nr:hypothetical protein IP88_05135 [alpha proteobacterium AAP81b]
MILIDTNVLSQPLRDDGERRVVDWLDAHDAEILIPAFAIAELVYGYEVLAFGRRRTELHDAVFALLTRYEDRIVAFDRPAAEAHGWLVAKLKSEGKPMPFVDSQIAAIAIARSTRVATRNIVDFKATGLELIDPWVA